MLARMRMSVKCFMWKKKKGGTCASAEYALQDIFRFLAH
ncbi:plasmid replication initiation protein [Enterobacter cloacae complex sp. 4DZ3-17B2]|uniref:Plasmid replication initiation protein n=1 Tax=Salmonella enterica subsp. enterica serovar Braenderup TaxID=149391 RepID=A0A5X0GCF4_SALET|nr:plasmid replication initiation protein [Salmonella enterica subsp. enterica serovar Braenderup]EDM7374191.1 plasmid replication initiation protein [Salmonella enterica subsp. enterica serovar Corvallis]RXX33863.1 plasmid replication initiation protein [Klebsiella pneumoniae]RYA46766.1 plasmid replication initiation protein [Enterobacter cloacae complex sp. GF14B]RYA57208.1 plasmid replication initiation protein [Enterobacter cloacae complex sp. 4DZ3-28B]RYA74003.1 plasmid replication initia